MWWLDTTRTHAHTHTQTRARARTRTHKVGDVIIIHRPSMSARRRRAIKTRVVPARVLFGKCVRREEERERERVMAEFFEDDFVPPVSVASSTAGSAAVLVPRSAMLAEVYTAAVTVGGAAGSSIGGRERERTGLGDRRTGVTGRGKRKHPIGQSEGWHVANGILYTV